MMTTKILYGLTVLCSVFLYPTEANDVSKLDMPDDHCRLMVNLPGWRLMTKAEIGNRASENTRFIATDDAGSSFTLRIHPIEGGNIDGEFAAKMDELMERSINGKKQNGAFLKHNGIAAYEHVVYCFSNGNTNVIRYVAVGKRLYLLHFLTNKQPPLDTGWIDKVMSMLSIEDPNRPAPDAKPAKEVAVESGSGITLGIFTGGLILKIFWLSVIISALRWLIRLLLFKPRRLGNGIMEYGAVRNQFILLHLILVLTVVVSFSTTFSAGGGPQAIRNFFNLCWGLWIVILIYLAGCIVVTKIRTKANPGFTVMNVASVIAVMVTVGLLLVGIRQIIFG